MGLTRIRADQISDIDYKQAVRVLTLSNVTLSGGAPSQVDGVNLNFDDRILVAGQTTASQNGIYYVATLGSGVNGTWVRASDANATGEIDAGMIVMVTEGNTYEDTSWKLITNNPIVVGTTSLVFAQNTGDSFGVINANGTAVVANSVTSTAIFNSGNNLVLTGNATSDTITFAVSDTPVFTTVSASGNIYGGNLSASGNVTATYYHGDGSYLTGIVPVIQAYLFANVASNISPYLQAVPINQFTVGALATATTTVGTTATLIGEFITNLGYPNATSIPAGQVTGRYETTKGNGAKLYTTYFTLVKRNLAGTETVLLTSDATTPTAVNTLVQQVTTALNISSISLLTTDRLAVKIYAYTASGTDDITLTWDDNTDSGFDLPTSPPSIADFVPYQNATANVFLGTYNLSTAGNVYAGNVITANTIVNSFLSSAGNVIGGNLLTAGYITATGNITGNFFIGNGSQLTGLPAGYANANAVAYGEAGWAGNIIPSANNVYSLGSPTAQWASVYVGNATLYLGTTPISANNTSNTLLVNGNTVVTTTSNGNIITTGYISATGNITGSYIIGNGSQLTGLPAGYSNTDVATYLSSGTVSTNILTTAAISATGNVTGNYIIGNGSLLTNINAGNITGAYGNANVANYLPTFTGNLTAGNISVTGAISTANITMSGDLIVGTGPTLTIDPNGSGGTDGNVVITGNLTVQGTTTTINSNTISTNDLTINMANNAANATAANNGGIEVGPVGSPYATLLYNTAANVWVASLGISSVGNITTTRNVTSGNILTTGLVSATGNVTSGNILTAGLISATGNIIGGNIVSGAGVGGNINGANYITANIFSASGNILTAGTVSATGNVTGNYILGNGALLTGVITSVANINLGNSNVTVTSSGGNVTVGVGGTNNIAVFATTGVYVTGVVSATGNIIGGNIVSGAGVGGNISGANVITGNIFNAVTVSASGNITGSYLLGNGSQITGLPAGYANSDVATYLASGTVSSNILTTAAISATGNVTGASLVGTIATAAQPTITSVGTLTSLNSGAISSSGNVTGANILTAGVVSATGNVTGNYFVGDGSLLTGNINNANVAGTVTTNAQPNITSVGTLTSLSVTGNTQIGNILAPGNITAGNIISNNNMYSSIYYVRAAGAIRGNSTATATYGVFDQAVDASATRTINFGTGGLSGTATTAINIGTQFGTSNTTVYGNFIIANTFTSLSTGVFNLTGNVSAGNLLTSGLISASGTIIGGTLSTTGGVISATVNASGNIVAGGNLSSAGNASAAGNVYGNILIGNTVSVGTTTSFSNSATTGDYIGSQKTTGGLTIGNTIQTGTINIGQSIANQIIGIASGVTGSGNTKTINIGQNGASGSNTNITMGPSAGVGAVNIGSGTTMVIANTSGTALSVAGNITGGNISATNHTGTIVSVTGNVTAGNILTTGNVSATGNVTGNYFIGNGSALTGITVSGSLSWTTQANTAPSSVNPGSFWYDSYSGVKYQYTNDGTGNVWVDQSFPTSFTTLAVTGNATIGGNLGVSGTLTANTISYGNISSPGYVSAVGNVYGSTLNIGNIVSTNANGVGNIGSSSNYFNRIFATATTALYADLAEMYSADQDYVPGTVVEFGGLQEIRASQTTHSTSVAGIISTNPSYLMNAAQPGEYALPVALTGRVPCQVVGKIVKGDRLVASDIPGVATVLDIAKYAPSCIIGKALENYDSTEVGVIEVAVGRT